MNIWLKHQLRNLAPCIGFVALAAGSTLAQQAQPKLNGATRVALGGPPPAGAPVPRADVVAPTVPGRISPDLIAVNRGPSNAPCELFDVVDPKTSQKVRPETVLPDGTTAGKYWAARNAIQTRLCPLGWSLRPGPGVVGTSQKIPLQYVRVNYAKLQQQGQDLALKYVPAPQKPPLSMSQAAQTFRSIVTIDPGLLKTVGVGQASNLHAVKNWDYSLGDTSTIAVSSNGKMEVDGTPASTSLAAEAHASGALFGHTFDFLEATGNLSTPKTGPLTINVNASAAGFNIYSKSLSETSTFTQVDSVDKTVDESTSTQFAILGIPFTAKVGIHGTVKLPYSATVTPLKAGGVFTPAVNSFGYAQVGADIGGIQAGVGGRLTVMNLNGNLNGSVAIVPDAKNQPTYSYNLQYCQTLDALDGDLFVFLNVGIGSFSTEIDQTIFSFKGIKSNGCLINESRNVPVFAQSQTLPGKR